MIKCWRWPDVSISVGGKLPKWRWANVIFCPLKVGTTSDRRWEYGWHMVGSTLPQPYANVGPTLCQPKANVGRLSVRRTKWCRPNVICRRWPDGDADVRPMLGRRQCAIWDGLIIIARLYILSIIYMHVCCGCRTTINAKFFYKLQVYLYSSNYKYVYIAVKKNNWQKQFGRTIFYNFNHFGPLNRHFGPRGLKWFKFYKCINTYIFPKGPQ
jgi:hypothetical protein